MKPQRAEQDESQLKLEVPLLSFLNPNHQLIHLGQRIDWEFFNREFGLHYSETKGRPGLSTRLMVALNYLKFIYDCSDERVVEEFLENGYWQYFCGFEYFQHQFPCNPSSMTRWRKRIGEEGAEKLLSETLKIAQDLKLLRSRDCHRVIVDTTVQEKNITYPTDAKLLNRARKKLVKAAKKRSIELRQSYERVSKGVLLRQARYAHAKQFKRARRSTRKLKTYLGRVMRDIQRKCPVPDEELKNLLSLAQRIYNQKKEDHAKVYSLHEPHVECISKGKSRNPYEFGCKVSLTSTLNKNWILGAKAVHGNPFDGKTLKAAVEQVKGITGIGVKEAFVDRGYRGSANWPREVSVYVSGRRRLSFWYKKLLKRRSAIEPLIGHLKQDHRMEVNRLKGVLGDQLNAVFAASAFNMRKIMRSFFLFFLKVLQKMRFLHPMPIQQLMLNL